MQLSLSLSLSLSPFVYSQQSSLGTGGGESFQKHFYSLSVVKAFCESGRTLEPPASAPADLLSSTHHPYQSSITPQWIPIVVHYVNFKDTLLESTVHSNQSG